MKTPATVLDAVYRASFSNETHQAWRSNAEMRRALENARRFVLDERMSAFMAELANESFIRAGVGAVKGKPNKRIDKLVSRLADSLRIQSRLPHQAIWIEYFMRPYQHRAHELSGNKPPIDSELPCKEGWLIQQHPKIDTACIMHLFTQADGITDSRDGFKLWTFPFAFGWCCDESPLPWQKTVDGPDGIASYMAVGLRAYHRENFGYVSSPLIHDPSQFKGAEKAYKGLLHEWVGVLRRVWSLLATIDNLPLTVGQTRTGKGFLARGRIRPFLDHRTITLNVPASKDTRVLAREAIAVAHRKRHEVRAHWRDDWRHPPSKECNPHLWEFVTEDNSDLIECSVCRGRSIHVTKHERGDAALGYVTHSYQLIHKET